MLVLPALLDWLPPFTPERLVLCAAVFVAVAVAVRAAVGGASPAARSPVLWIVRGLIFAGLCVLLLGPVRVETTPGALDRPEVLLLYDASESMALGEPNSRWAEIGTFLSQADGGLRDGPAHLGSYTFGRRLRAVEAEDSGTTRPSPAMNFAALAPTEGDTRLAVALRQLTGRIGREPPAGVVLFSDGRTRDPEAAAAAADTFAQLEVPIHVVPVGGGSGGGDVAIVGAAAPERVRKYSENQMTVFLRSFGYDGRRVEVRLLATADSQGPEQALAAVPITLAGGVQSVTIPFRSEARSRTLRVEIPPGENEVSEANNRFDLDIEIDRTKLRVLYIEGSDEPVRLVPRGDEYDVRGPHSTLADALSEDPDIECVTLVTAGRGALQVIDRNYRGTTSGRGFPDSTAELFAFDAVILSNVSRDLMTDEQIARLERLIGRRGAGLCMVGGPKAFSDGDWGSTPLADVLPVELPASLLSRFFGRGTWDAGEVTLRPAAEAVEHPLWRLSADAAQNKKLLDALPATPGSNGPLRPKPVLAEVLGVGGGDAASPGPLMVSGRYGRGRTLAISPQIAGPPGADPLVDGWGTTQGAYFGKLWRNAVYWLTENSSIGRRRLLVETDKRFYRPEETVALRGTAYGEAADRTDTYRVMAMIEPKSLDIDLESLDSPLVWPTGRPRTSGEDSPFVTWGEEIELRPGADGRYELDLEITRPEDEAADIPAVRVELTAYEGQTQVDSTSVDVQILDDPFERRAPFPDHDLLKRIASRSGGQVFSSPGQLTDWIAGLPVRVGPETTRREPVWDRWPVLLGLLGLLTVDWIIRRKRGLA